MTIVDSVAAMQRMAGELRAERRRIGLVPTMGFLHEGHLSLMRRAREHADTVVTSIFVNPTQFAPHEDFSRYPRDLAKDTRLAEAAGTDILFTPSVAGMYPEGYRTTVDVAGITALLEGKTRPTHFRGVTTVVAKLFHITVPHVAVFGQKDAQQAVVIRRMVRDLNLDVEIVVAPTVREPDGVAMSSRNVYLSPAERTQAQSLSQSLSVAERLVAGGERRAEEIVAAMRGHISRQAAAAIDYISVADAETLEEASALEPGRRYLVSLAVRIGSTRLIDNTVIAL
jgi:pantoate--beta-alanine ligase